jgi:hypothetical protein
MKYYKIIPSECTEGVINYFKDRILRELTSDENSALEPLIIMRCTFAKHSDYYRSELRRVYSDINCRGWWFQPKDLEEVIIT